MNEIIVLYGTKLEAEKVLYFCKVNHIDCEYVIDNYEQGMFHGYNIVKLSAIEMLNSFCVVACGTYNTYSAIKKQLIAKGYKEFQDFIWSKLWKKKIVVINANCHGTALRHYLESSECFRDRYAIYPVPEIYLNDKKEIDENILQHADVFIHQDIRTNNKISYKLGDEYTLSFLPTTAIRICMPNFVGLGNIFHQDCAGGGGMQPEVIIQLLCFFKICFWMKLIYL